jgi:LemA protein
MPITIILISILLLAGIVFLNKFNAIKSAQNQIQNALSSLDALLIKRHDLIPNLIVLLKQYMVHEKSTLEAITQLRQRPTTPPQAEYVKDNELNQQIKGLLVQVENYPELKANQQFNNIHFSWNEAEEQIAAGRRFVSASITDFNNQISTFPGNVIANMMNLQFHQWQKASESQQQNINANDLFQ